MTPDLYWKLYRLLFFRDGEMKQFSCFSKTMMTDVDADGQTRQVLRVNDPLGDEFKALMPS